MSRLGAALPGGDEPVGLVDHRGRQGDRRVRVVGQRARGGRERDPRVGRECVDQSVERELAGFASVGHSRPQRATSGDEIDDQWVSGVHLEAPHPGYPDRGLAKWVERVGERVELGEHEDRLGRRVFRRGQGRILADVEPDERRFERLSGGEPGVRAEHRDVETRANLREIGFDVAVDDAAGALDQVGVHAFDRGARPVGDVLAVVRLGIRVALLGPDAGRDLPGHLVDESVDRLLHAIVDGAGVDGGRGGLAGVERDIEARPGLVAVGVEAHVGEPGTGVRAMRAPVGSSRVRLEDLAQRVGQAMELDGQRRLPGRAVEQARRHPELRGGRPRH